MELGKSIKAERGSCSEDTKVNLRNIKVWCRGKWRGSRGQICRGPCNTEGCE